MNNNNATYAGGFGIGSLIAVVMSWEVNHSILWAIVHAILGWFYVIYRLVIFMFAAIT
jgi:hypothetical protein